MIKLILSDLDETLIHFGLEHATDHALDGIHAALDAGVHFSAITGRVFAGVLSALLRNGSLLERPGRARGRQNPASRDP